MHLCLIYNYIVMLIYEILSTVLFLILLPIYYVVRVCNKKFLYGWKEKLGFFENPNLGNKVILYHGVSVGEVIALENVIKKTKESFPDYKLVVTTGTKTGQEIAQKKFKDVADYITYLPFDISFCVKQFLNKVRPSVALIAETELWPTFAYECKRRNILLYTINGRMSDSTYSLYKFIRAFYKHVFPNYTGILTQSQEDMDKFVSVGAPKEITSVMKNLKFDVKKSDDVIEMGKGNSRLIIAGSTHKGEDEIVFDAFKTLKEQFSDIKLLIAPRHPQRVPNVLDLAKATGLAVGTRSNSDVFLDKEIIILDTMGELGKMYSICDFAFIGGSFNKTGGHNPLEAVVYGKPAISGPSIHNFKDIYGILGKSKAGKVVKTPQELEEYMRLMLSDVDFYNQACKDCEFVFEDQKGALDVVISTLKGVL